MIVGRCLSEPIKTLSKGKIKRGNAPTANQCKAQLLPNPNNPVPRPFTLREHPKKEAKKGL